MTDGQKITLTSSLTSNCIVNWLNDTSSSEIDVSGNMKSHFVLVNETLDVNSVLTFATTIRRERNTLTRPV